MTYTDLLLTLFVLCLFVVALGLLVCGEVKFTAWYHRWQEKRAKRFQAALERAYNPRATALRTAVKANVIRFSRRAL